GFQDIDTEDQIGFSVRNDVRGEAAVGLENEVRVNAAVANGQALLVAKLNVKAFLVSGANKCRRRNPDAHAADAGQINAPVVIGDLARRKRQMIQIDRVNRVE